MKANLLKFLKADSGSATLEFVVLAIPLFLPLFFFFAQVNQSGNSQALVENFVSQAARAYATAPSEEIGLLRIEQIKTIFQSNRFQSDSSKSNQINLNYSISCESIPCLTPDKKITVTAELNTGKRYIASNTEIIDKWRNY